MTDIGEDRIRALFILAQQQEGAGITGVQLRAVEQLREIAARKNNHATAYLARLNRLPDIHPFVREMLRT